MYLEMFKELPHVNVNYEVVNDWGYTPNLYHFDGKWFVDWIHCEEGDSLFSYQGDSPEEAITNAYKDYKNKIRYEG